MKKRLFCLLLALALALTLFPAAAFAEDGVDAPETIELIGEEEFEAQPEEAAEPLALPDPEGFLGDPYFTLAERIEAQLIGVSVGQIFSTKFEIDYSDLGIDYNDVAEHISPILHVVIRNCGYELFWWGDPENSSHARGDGILEQSFTVAPDYRGEDEYSVDPEKIRGAQTAVARAEEIVDAHASDSDREKLRAYFDEIRALCDYDYDAFESSMSGATPLTAGSNPWNMIYVFDGDPDTKVICTGFARAFEYLCDRSIFQGEVTCFCVSGTLGGGKHTWNLVTVDGERYLMDVTLGLYLVRPVSGSVDEGYLLADGRRYVYDSFTMQCCDSAELTLPLGMTAQMDDDGTLTLCGEGAFNQRFSTSAFAAYGAKKIVFSEGFTSLGDYVFYGCADIEEIELPDSLRYIGDYAFCNCTALRRVKMPAELDYLGTRAFCNDSALTEVTVPPGTPDLLDYTFYNCASLPGTLILPDGLKTVGEYALGGCPTLEALVLSDSLESVGKYALLRDGGLQTVSFRGSAPAIDALAFYGTEMTARYPGSLASWNAETLVRYGGKPTWTPYTPVSSATFPDAAFRADVQTVFDIDLNGELNDDELASVIALDVSDREIASLQGVELLTALTELNCQYNRLTALDLSQNTALTKLDCSGNALTALDVSACTGLTELYCAQNLLAVLNVSGCSALTALDCSENALTALDVTGCPELTMLYCQGNGLAALNVTGCPALLSLSCGSNVLTALDVTKCSLLEELSCGQNRLTALDLSNCPALRKLNCSGNQLSSLNLTRCPRMVLVVRNGMKNVSARITSYLLGSLSEPTGGLLVCDTGLRLILPLDPPELTEAFNSATGVRVSWKPMDGAVKYELLRKNLTKNETEWTVVGETTECSLIDKTVASASRYTFTVRALDEDGFAGEYDETGRTCTYIAKADVTDITVTAEGVSLKWSKPAGAKNFRVMRRPDGTAKWTVLDVVLGTEYLDTTAEKGVKYWYTVRGVSMDNTVLINSYNGTGWSMKPLETPVLTEAFNSATGVRVSWKPNDGAVKYRLLRKNLTKNEEAWSTVAETTELTFIDTSAASASRYTYTVECIDSNGRICSAQGNPRTCTYIAMAKITSIGGVTNGVKLTWSKPAGAKNFRVFRKVDGENTWTALTDVQGTTYTDTTAEKGVKYWYTVRAITMDGKMYINSYNSYGWSVTRK
ncbi:MAG: leucine-rich repeat protein [Oscillospiraceae bacterium]|nr:leucine-rich repeat protein [Oscillospiraceae bacterium]